jgi:hypothetical protein
MSNNSLNALVKQLKNNTEKVKEALAKNEKAAKEAMAAPTPAAAAGPANTAVNQGAIVQTLAERNQEIAKKIGAPLTIPEVQGPAQAAMKAANTNAKMANALAAQAVGAAPGTPAAAAAVGAATASTNAALAGKVPAANNAAQKAANAAVVAVANASPEAKRLANTIKKNLLNNPNRAKLNTAANRGKVAANILNTSYNKNGTVKTGGNYLNAMGAGGSKTTAANFERAYKNLMNSNLSNQRKNVVKRIYFSYMLDPVGGKRRANLTNNLNAFKTFNNYKASKTTK